MKELATVVNTAGKIATVQIEKKPECDSCKMCAFRNGRSRVKVRALNAVGAKPGDTVLVKAEKDNRLLASFIVYIVPVVLAGAGLLVGFFLLRRGAVYRAFVPCGAYFGDCVRVLLRPRPLQNARIRYGSGGNYRN